MVIHGSDGGTVDSVGTMEYGRVRRGEKTNMDTFILIKNIFHCEFHASMESGDVECPREIVQLLAL